MKNTIKASISVYKGYTAIIIVHNGKKIYSKVNKKNKTKSTIEIYLDLLKTTLSVCQNITRDTKYVTDENFEYSELIIDMRCNVLIKWVKDRYSKHLYREVFSEIIQLSDNIFIPYKLINNGATVANTFANPKFMEKETKYEPVSASDLFD